MPVFRKPQWAYIGDTVHFLGLYVPALYKFYCIWNEYTSFIYNCLFIKPRGHRQ